MTQCEGNLQAKDGEITNRQEQINKLTKEAQDTQNQKWLFGVGGVALAIFGTLFFTGKIGKRVKSKMDDFGKTGAS